MRTEIRPKSAMILKLAYDDEKHTLEVMFVSAPRAVYIYSNVMPAHWTALATSKSVGGEFSRLIKANAKMFPFTKHEIVEPISAPTADDTLAEDLKKSVDTTTPKRKPRFKFEE